VKLRKLAGVLAGAGIVAMVAGGGVAHADPVGPPTFRELAGVGSDTTTPIMNALANDASALAIGGVRQVASYNALGSAQITTKDPAVNPNCTINRPDGSGAGRAALLAQLQLPNNCLQFSRSSVLDLSAAAVQLTYIPFATESITFAITNTSSLPRSLTLAQLQGFFRCTNPGTYSAMLPQAGSGTRSYWITQMYVGGVLPNPVPACVQNGSDENGVPIQEHNGQQVGNSEIVPFSVAQWGSQTSGLIADVRGGTTLGQVDGTNPFSANFALQRDLYNVIPTSAEGTAPTSTVFVGPNALMCQAAASTIILRFGLRLNANCGSTALRTP